ncbi:hypothetical protein SAMN04488121_11176 [Chitinophaga filiformis]|uniref:Uncharacterized protein n=1 Tax=Chitinophaga filiformis TaxID=104663 RepID=A0A1G8BM91_CHIFI|nr:hypothetical protein SAMN04488121_11176 [Chitinophaga filiformis]
MGICRYKFSFFLTGVDLPGNIFQNRIPVSVLKSRTPFFTSALTGSRLFPYASPFPISNIGKKTSNLYTNRLALLPQFCNIKHTK